MTHEIIAELEAKLAEMRQDCLALEQTITYLRSIGYGVGEKKYSSPAVMAKPTECDRGNFIAEMKTAIESIGFARFTKTDMFALLPNSSAKKKENMSTRLGQLAEAGYLIRISKGVGRTPAVFQRVKSTTGKRISEFSPSQKEKAREALVRNGPAKFICDGCGETFPLCPQQCPKCSGRSFEELELSKESEEKASA